MAIIDPSKASLCGFDMVWAITQNAVNSQLAWLCGGPIPNQVKVGDIDRDGIVIDGAIAAPRVDFDTGENHLARLHLSFTGGKASYWSGFGPNAKKTSEPITDWKLAFKVRLNLGQLAHEFLTAPTPKPIPAEVLKILTRFDSTMFSVQSIFLDFQNSDLTTFDELHSVIKTQDSFVAQNFGKAIGSWISRFKGQENPFILGYPVTRKQPSQEAKAVFDPTGANLSSHSYEYPPGVPNDGSRNGLSTLNFLLVTGNRKITDEPALFAADAGSFHRNLVEDNDTDGKGIIARTNFFNEYLHKLLIEPLAGSIAKLGDYAHARDDARHGQSDFREVLNSKTNGFKSTTDGWFYEDHVKLSWRMLGGKTYHHRHETEQKLRFDVKVTTQPDASGAKRLTVLINGSLYRYEWDQVDQYWAIGPDTYLAKTWGSALLEWTITLQFIAGVDGRITITSSATQKPVVEKSGTGGVYEFVDVFRQAFNMQKISDDWRENAASMGNIEKGIAASFSDSTSSILNSAMAKIVMPASSQFFYKNIQLNANGDVEIDFTYKAEG